MSGAGARTLNVAGVRLSPTGRTFACDAGGLTLRKGDAVMIDGGHGAELATVAVASGPRAAGGALARVLRPANASDLARGEALRERTVEALHHAREQARARGLAIKVFRAELSSGGGGGGPGGARATFYFASEARVDFRELVRDLVAKHHARIEMRQVGVRDEAKMVGGIGSCGRELCCTTFLPRFAPVSIKMAKHQGLVLNPAKVSGQCGRLKCCLVYEEANYVEAAKALPKVGKRVVTPEGTGRVGDVDVLAGRVRVYFEDQPPKVFAAADVRPLAAPPGGGGGPPAGDARDHHEQEDPPEGLPSD